MYDEQEVAGKPMPSTLWPCRIPPVEILLAFRLVDTAESGKYREQEYTLPTLKKSRTAQQT